MARSRPYTPWRTNLRNSLILGITGIVAVYAAYSDLIIWPVGLGIGVIAFYLAYGQIRRGKNRKFGKDFEWYWLGQAEASLKGFGIKYECGRLVRGLGDIDLIVTNRHGSKITVEIKSFIHWKQFGPFKGMRESKALGQAAAQRLAIDADRAVVWLPQGRPGLLQRIFGWMGNEDVTVLFGGTQKLARWIRDFR